MKVQITGFEVFTNDIVNIRKDFLRTQFESIENIETFLDFIEDKKMWDDDVIYLSWIQEIQNYYQKIY